MKTLLQNLADAANTAKQCEKDLANVDRLYKDLAKLREAASKGQTYVWLNMPYSISPNVIAEAHRITGCDVNVASHCKSTLEISWKE